MMTRCLLFVFVGTSLFRGGLPLSAAEPANEELFGRKNLVAWCIVPFDSKKRGPEERAAMLERLGFTKFAYDYRAEHIPTFDDEIEALKRHQIELTAWWFPTVLNDEAIKTLALFERHGVTPQLWVTGGGEPTKTDDEQRQRVAAEAGRIRPIAEAAHKIGCKVALYNHGGWFGEPENQIAIIRELGLPNVGIVYNQHHGHDHIDRFPELLKTMSPYLLTLNLNGMVKNGDRAGQKILQLGQGDLDVKLLQIVRDSGYKGPIGIIGHTDDDAEARLRDNLDGLDWLRPQLEGKEAGPRPKPQTPVPPAKTAAVPGTKLNLPRLADGKFRKALDGRAGGAFVAGSDVFHDRPITVECWTKLSDKGPYNILLANETKSSGTHWQLFTTAGTGNITVYTPGMTPDHCHSTAMICNGQWHHVAMIMEPERIRLFVDGQIVANQACERNAVESVAGDLAIASLVETAAGTTGLIDEVRISRGVRSFDASPTKPYDVDENTIALWHFDEVADATTIVDATGHNDAKVGQTPVDAAATAQAPSRLEGHWGEDALGFRWTEQDSRDDRLGQMDTGPFFSGSITGPGGIVYKGIVVRVGESQSHAVCYDTELMRTSAGWKGFLRFDPARFGIIVPPKIEGEITFATPLLAGLSRGPQFQNPRESYRFGPLPKSEAHYEGLYRHGQRVVLKFTVPTEDPSGEKSDHPIEVLESPWLEEAEGVTAQTRTIRISPSHQELSILIADPNSLVRLVGNLETAVLGRTPDNAQIVTIAPRNDPVTIKLLITSSAAGEIALDQLAATSPAAEDLVAMTQPGPSIWGEPLVTTGEVSKNTAPYVVDTITLPFDNRFHALMFCGGHDFLPDGRAVVCTLHGDVWLVDGIDESLQRITWHRFATGLFQPLGVKTLSGGLSRSGKPELYVVGRDQITRLHDFNGDGEADFYENFNNDAHVSLNGHEYVTCLETDRAGNFYFLKGNCDSAIPHDGSVLRVSRNGSKLDVFATGFRNANGMSIGPNDEITVAPQEGEWTPASAVFSVRQGGFYGGMMSHHRPVPPTDFQRPFCWFPRLADNSCGGQVWVTSEQWGPLQQGLLHLSYGQCKLRLLLRENVVNHDNQTERVANAGSVPNASNRTLNGGSTEFPLTFASGIHRGRFHPRDGQLYVTGLKGWVSSAVNDGCFQRVRYTGLPFDLLVGMKTYRNGIALTFSDSLNRDDAESIDNYELEAWNYRWSAEYGSPDFKPSGPGQIGRDAWEPRSATLLSDNRTVFLELPELKAVDQLGITYTLNSARSTSIEQTSYLTLNRIPSEIMPEEQLHRPRPDPEKLALVARLVPGVTFVESVPQLMKTMTSRLVAWNGSGSDSPREVTATGYLKVPFTGEYRFNVETVQRVDQSHPEPSATLKKQNPTLEINGAIQEFAGPPISVRLRKGLSRIIVRDFASEKDSLVRLMWETDRFPRESIPATALFHDQAAVSVSEPEEQIAAGHRLYEKHHCSRCHRHDTSDGTLDDFETIIERQRSAPRLDGIGSRLEPVWLAMWLRNPNHLHADATMPSLIEAHDDRSVNDLVAYLATLHERQSSAPPRSEPDAAHVEKGAELFERLGCIACHTLAPNDPHEVWNRRSLHFVKAKFQPGQLERFLKHPHRHHAGSHMPDFHLVDEEVSLLAGFLESTAQGSIPSQENLATGNAEQGKKLFSELRCDHCHQPNADAYLKTPNLPSVFVPEPKTGCLGETKSPGTPKFVWTESERNALKTYLASSSKTPGFTQIAQQPPLERILKTLRCSACHSRDGTPAVWPEISAEEGSGRLSESVPHLTWVGEKLQGPWIAKLLKGDVAKKPRPWLKARMPSFPAYADLLANAMAAEHGVPFHEHLPLELDPNRVETGRKLTLRDGGLDCRQCHGVGDEQPRGDAATQIALGINFALTRDRLRPEFSLRQILDPPRYDIGSRMPRFAPDLQTTAAKQIEGGNARKQFEAITQYLWSLKFED